MIRNESISITNCWFVAY